MPKCIFVAMVLAAGAMSAMLPDPASARDTGPYGDSRARCRYFAQPIPFSPRDLLARPALSFEIVHWDKRLGRAKLYQGYPGHSSTTRCLAGF
jgi:hypothetical protein